MSAFNPVFKWYQEKQVNRLYIKSVHVVIFRMVEEDVIFGKTIGYLQTLTKMELGRWQKLLWLPFLLLRPFYCATKFTGCHALNTIIYAGSFQAYMNCTSESAKSLQIFEEICNFHLFSKFNHWKTLLLWEKKCKIYSTIFTLLTCRLLSPSLLLSQHFSHHVLQPSSAEWEQIKG